MEHVPRSKPDISELTPLPTEQDGGPSDQQELIDEIKATADKLLKDQATRGDLKLLSRALKELRYAFKVFKPLRRNRKVTVFGSARTPPGHPAYQAAVDFAKAIAAEGWYVVTGAGGGIMEAGHVGAGKRLSIGVNIILPFEQAANFVIDKDEKLINLKYFFTRKLLFVKEVHAIALFAGGFGTQDELFETLTLVQTGKRDLMPIVCVDVPGGTYWKQWRDFVVSDLLEPGWISPEDLSLFHITDSTEDAVEEIMRFYSVYHSMRYVRRKLVLRLHRRPTPEMMLQLNRDFLDVTEAGEITLSGALPDEADEPHIAHLPRLVLQFNRKYVGRLRQMVDFLNSSLALMPDDLPDGTA
jgi:uncharacterized protein (TIGR00730 family)